MTTADIRVYYGHAGYRKGQVLTREQAVAFLATGELPEDILLAAADREQIGRYLARTPAEQAEWRRVGGSLTVANGHEVIGSDTHGAYTAWEPYEKQICEVFCSPSDSRGYISVGGTSCDLQVSLGFLQAQAMAWELLAAATARKVIPATGEEA